MSKKEKKPALFEGRLRTDYFLIFVFGLLALISVILLSFFSGDTTDFQKSIIWALLALGISAVSVFLPGLIEVRIPKFLRAGGAIALFVFIFSQSPVGQDIKERIFPPDDNIQDTVDSFLHLMDSSDYETAYNNLSEWSKSAYPREIFLQLASTYRAPLSHATGRDLAAVNSRQDPSGYPPGAYRIYMYFTNFSGKAEQIIREYVLLGQEGGAWQVFEYTIGSEP